MHMWITLPTALSSIFSAHSGYLNLKFVAFYLFLYRDEIPFHHRLLRAEEARDNVSKGLTLEDSTT